MIRIPTHIREACKEASFIARRMGGKVISEGNLDALVGTKVVVQIVSKLGLGKGGSAGIVDRVRTQPTLIGLNRCSTPSVSIDNREEGWTHRVDTFHIGRNRYLVIYRAEDVNRPVSF